MFKTNIKCAAHHLLAVTALSKKAMFHRKQKIAIFKSSTLNKSSNFFISSHIFR